MSPPKSLLSSLANGQPPLLADLKCLYRKLRPLQIVPESAASVFSGPGCQPTSFSFAVMTYNLLAQHHIWNDIYPYCHDGVLRQSSRRLRLLAELEAYGPMDIACFQEVAPVGDEKDFWRASWNALGSAACPSRNSTGTEIPSGYEAVIDAKADGKDGIATIYAPQRFHLLAKEALSFAPLMTALEATPNIAQILHLRHIPTQTLFLVSNTHLFWRPEFDCLRVLQAHRLRKRLEAIAASAAEPVVLVSCGDWNSDPKSAVYLLMTGQLSSISIPDREALINSHASLLPFGDAAASLERSTRLFEEVWHDFEKWPKMTSAYSVYRSPSDPQLIAEPPHTSVNTYVDTLDYIFFRASPQQATIQPSQLLMLPPNEIVFAQTALPNEVYASDHLALVATLQASINS